MIDPIQEFLGTGTRTADSPASHSPAAPPSADPATGDSRLAPGSARIASLSCDQAKVAVDAIRPDIAANGPNALRTLLAQTDALLERSSHWSKCQRAARYRAILALYGASRKRNDGVMERGNDGDTTPTNPSIQPSTIPPVSVSSVDPSEASGPPKPQADSGLLPYQTAADTVPFFDLVIPLGTQSKRDDLELRYLLRSALECLPVVSCQSSVATDHRPRTTDHGLRLIHLIGPRRPAWLVDHPMVRWHQWTPVKPKNHDIVAKFIHAANHPDVAEHFLGSCDDFLFLRPFRPGIEYGAVRRHGVLSTCTDQGYWKKAQAETRSLLLAAGYKAEFFDYHVPTLMTKTGWRRVDAEIPWQSVPGHAVWSLYHNVAGVHGPSLGRDGRSHCGWHAGDGSKAPADLDDVERAAHGCLFMNYNDGGLRGGTLETWLAQRFPTPAPWEKDQTAKTPGTPRNPTSSPTSPLGPVGPTPESPTGSAGTSASPSSVAMPAIAGANPSLPSITVVCVLRTGSRYSQCHVRWLRDQVTRNLRNPHRFVCLSDVAVEGIECIALTTSLPRNWAKLEMFRPGLFGDSEIILFSDLDNVWHRELSVPDPGDGLYMCDEHTPFPKRRITWNSSVMLWKGPRPAPFEHALALHSAGEDLRRHFPGDQECIAAGNYYRHAPAKGIEGKVNVRFSDQSHYYRAKPSPTGHVMAFYACGPRPWDEDAPEWAKVTIPLQLPHSGLVFCSWGDDPRQIDAVAKGIRRTMGLLRPSPARALLVESLPEGAVSALAPICVEWGISYVRHTETNRHHGVWRKESLWNMGWRHLVAEGGMEACVFLDGDTYPSHPDWLARIYDRLIEERVRFLQPWDNAVDTQDGKQGASRSASAGSGGNPGRAWAARTDFLLATGGFPTIPLSTCDTVTMAAWTGHAPPNAKLQGMPWFLAAMAKYRPPQGTEQCVRFPETLTHISHGTKKRGYYNHRNHLLSLFCSDADQLVQLDAYGVTMLQDTDAAKQWATAASLLSPTRDYSDSEIEELALGNLPHTYRDLFGYFDWEDCYREIVEGAPNGATLLELGVLCAKSTAFLAVEAHNARKGLNVVAIDMFMPVSAYGTWTKSYSTKIGLSASDTFERVARENLSSCGAPVSLVKGDQHTVHAQYADESLWAVWLDTDHQYESTLSALREWWPKISPGGVFGGHDYATWPGVYRAVDQWVSENGLSLSARGVSFMVRKEEKAMV